MLDMGFLPDIRQILALLPASRQNLLFSATFSDAIKALANRLLDRPDVIEVTPRNSTVDSCGRRSIRWTASASARCSRWLIGTNRWQQVLVFTRTKHGADKLAEQLSRDGIKSVALHGNKTQGARTRALEDFKTRRHHGAGRDRHRRARHRHRGAAARRQLRPAERSRGLRAPHRAHGPRRGERRSGLADVRRRARVRSRHRAPDQAVDSARDDQGLRAGSEREGPAGAAASAPGSRAGSCARCTVGFGPSSRPGAARARAGRSVATDAARRQALARRRASASGRDSRKRKG